MSSDSIVGVDRGILYEPRSFWDVQHIVMDSATPSVPVVTRFDRENLRNGGRYPVTLTSIALAPINYALRENPDTGVPTPEWYRNCGAMLNLQRIMIGAPQRQHYSRTPILLPAWSAENTAEPSMRNVTATPWASNPFGVSHLAFDRPLRMNQYGTVEMELTGWSWTTDVIADHACVKHSVLWQELGGYHQGAGRLRDRETLQPMNWDSDPTFTPDGFGPKLWLAGQRPMWPALNKMNGQAFAARNPLRSGGIVLSGVSVHIDQIDYDDGLQADLQQQGLPITPFSLRVGSKVRTVNGGSQEYWWRPGAPLALTMTTITPAQVYKLDPIITLAPGDALDVEILAAPIIAGMRQDITYNMGIALNGFVPIEG